MARRALFGGWVGLFGGVMLEWSSKNVHDPSIFNISRAGSLDATNWKRYFSLVMRHHNKYLGLGVAAGLFHWFAYDQILKPRLGKEYALPFLGAFYGAGYSIYTNQLMNMIFHMFFGVCVMMFSLQNQQLNEYHQIHIRAITL